MPQIQLKKNEASELAFPMVETASPEDFLPGLTVTGSSASKDGAAAWSTMAALTNSITEIDAALGTGIYEVTLTAAELNHDFIMVFFQVTGAVGQDTAFFIKTYANDVDDAVTVAAGGIPVGGFAAGAITAAAVAVGAIDSDAFVADAIDAAAIDTGAIVAATFFAGAIDAAAIDTGAIDADALASDAVDEIVDQVWDELRAGHVIADSFGQGVASVQGNVTGSVASVVAIVTANATQISASTAAADNLELDYSGPGFARPSSTIGTVTTVTNAVAVDTIHADVINAAAIAGAAGNKIADHVIRRSYGTCRASTDGDAVGELPIFRSLLGAIAIMVNRREIVGVLHNIYHEDDEAPVFATQTVIEDASLEPIRSLDTN
jgi:hypothetical protein